MNREYWDQQADDWEGQIFDSLSEDLRGVIRRAIQRAARRSDRVLDFGCGVGGYLSFLSREFREVHAIDWSARCVARARERTRRLGNVTVERNTPRVLRRLEGAFGCVVAANVVIHPNAGVRRRLWLAIRRTARRGATSLFVVPSLESAQYCERVRRRLGLARAAGANDVRAAAGIVPIEGVPTKHYAADELRSVLAAAGFRLTVLTPVRYAWSSEGLAQLAGTRRRLPWDWLAEARAV